MGKCIECENIYDRKKGVIVSKCGARYNKPVEKVETKVEVMQEKKSAYQPRSVRASPVKEETPAFSFEENNLLPEEVNE